MSYNAGYDMDLDRYDKETGTITKTYVYKKDKQNEEYNK